MTNGGDQEPDARLEVLKAAVQEGLASGNSGKTVQGIMHEVEVRLRKNGVLQDRQVRLHPLPQEAEEGRRIVQEKLGGTR